MPYNQTRGNPNTEQYIILSLYHNTHRGCTKINLYYPSAYGTTLHHLVFTHFIFLISCCLFVPPSQNRIFVNNFRAETELDVDLVKSRQLTKSKKNEVDATVAD